MPLWLQRACSGAPLRLVTPYRVRARDTRSRTPRTRTTDWELWSGRRREYAGASHAGFEAAELLKVRESWLRKKAAARVIPCTFLGKHLRFSDEDITEIVRSGTRKPRGATPPARSRSLHREKRFGGVGSTEEKERATRWPTHNDMDQVGEPDTRSRTEPGARSRASRPRRRRSTGETNRSF